MKKHLLCFYGGMALAVASLFPAPNAYANVYATDIRLDGSLTNAVSVGQGSPLAISYILNEAATAGVTIDILSGETVVRSISIASGPGTERGANSVQWDGKANGGGNASIGTYSVRITAAATGYSEWTQISDDNAPGSYIFRPRSIAVNKNPGSPYYGRVFVGNVANNGTSTAFGDVSGIYKLNADGSLSEDGSGTYGTANYPFSGTGYYDGFDNPLNMKVKEDDRLYWNNWVGKGEVVASDMLLTTNQVVIGLDNYANNPYYPGTLNWKTFEITDILTDHARVYLCDAGYPSAGAWYWPLTNGVVDVNDPNATVGYQAIATGGDLSLRCDGIAIDANTNVYVIQTRSNAGDSNMRAASWTNWDGVSLLFDGAAWVVGGADDTFRNQYNLSLDSTENPHYLAVGMSALTTGGIRILNVTDGSNVVENLSATDTYHGVNWDAVGNLYGGSQSSSRWRVFSPPGANQATTVAYPQVEITAAVTPVQIGQVSVSGGNITINFSSDSADVASAFTLQSATTVDGLYQDVSATVTQTGSGTFQVVVPVNGPASFYRLKK